METLVTDDVTGDGVLVTAYPRCKNCERLEWFHPGGCCLYTPHKFKPQLNEIGVTKDKGIFYVEHWKGSRKLWKYAGRSNTSNDVWPHSEVIYWCHYLTEIGWKP